MPVPTPDTPRPGLHPSGGDSGNEAPDAVVHGMFAATARAHPDRIAVEDGREALTYAALDARADRLAALLRRHGVAGEARVGVLAERGVARVVACLAILKAGGAYVPLDPAYPASRLREMADDAGLHLVLAGAGAEAELPAEVPVLAQDAAEAEAAESAALPIESGASPESLAYLLFTSGSTGRPRAVMVPHRGVARLVRGAGYHDFRPDEVYLHFAPAVFDASTFELWAPLLSGARLVVFPPHTPSLEELGAFVESRKITTLWLTAGLFHALAEARPESFRGVRTLLAGGDVLSPRHCRRVLEASPTTTLVNGYGPTEVTCFTACHRMEGAAAVADPVPIGGPIGGTTVHLLDGSLRPVPPGASGELYAGGAGVARGYRGAPGRTAERFLPDPFSPTPGARLYRTGDRARLRPDGALEFLGRVDRQVKIRGHRVEPGEVETFLAARPGLRAVAVEARADGGGDRMLVAYLVPAAPGAVAEARAAAEAELPSHLRPSAWVELGALPLTPNGKVDRDALPHPAATGTPAGAPRTAVEELLAGAWAEALGVGEVGVEENVFSLGAHSLAALRVAARAREALGVELSLATLFAHPTVAALAAAVSPGDGAPPPFPPIRRVPRGGPLPVSAAQEGVWIVQQIEPGSRAYHFEATVRIRGALSVECLERALTEVVRRHEILRTTFPTEEGRMVQRVCPPWTVRLPVVELGHLPPAAREEAATAWMREHFGLDFDLAALPLIRLTLLRLAPDDHLLVDVEHHLVHDGWSANLLLGETAALYRAFHDGRPSPLPELEVQFADFAVWQCEWMQSEAARAQLAYWRARLAGAGEPLELPGDRPRPAAPSFRGAAPRFTLSRARCDALRAASRREGVTLFMLLLAGFKTLLARWSGESSLTVGTAVAGRRHRQVEGLIGMFVNMVALRSEVGDDPSFRELLHRVRRTTLEAYANQDVPFEAVVEAVRPERALSHNPLFQVAFSYHSAPPPDLALPGAEVEVSLGLGNGSAKFDLSVIVLPEGDECALTLVWEHAFDRFDPATVERMVEGYLRLLDAAAADPARALSSLPLLSEAARREVVERWNPAAPPAPWTGGVPARVAEHARRAPDAVAVEAPDGTLTYAALDAASARLAAALRGRGAGPGTLVAVLAERGADAVVAMLAAMRAGAAYLPLDPAHPSERIAALLADGAPSAVVASAPLAGRLPPGTPFLSPDAGAAPLPDPPLHPAEAAYLIHTSGSTGTPKGVVATHGGLAALTRWHAEAFALAPGDRATQVAAPAFDAAAWEVWSTLAAGATLHVVPDEVRGDPEALRDRLAAARISVAFVPTPVAEPLLALPWPSATALRFLLVGGDRLRLRPPAGLPFRVVNAYGPTEATVVATAGEVAPEGEGAPGIGLPVAGATAYVLDPKGAPVPPGVPGELYLGGAGVARGYRGEAALTAARFLPDPFTAVPGGRLYRTGDRAVRRRDGTLEFGGRMDRQTKVRGVRVEPGEVEAALLAHPGVREAAVVALSDLPDGEARLVAYLAGDGTDDGDLRSALRARLPAALVPGAYLWLPRLPLGATGKVDRGALPPPPPPGSSGGSVAPRTPTEEALAAVWREVLGRETVGAHDDFFALGGNSLQATRVGARVRERLGVDLPVRALFEAPTLAELAERVASALPAAPPAEDRIRPLARRARPRAAGLEG